MLLAAERLDAASFFASLAAKNNAFGTCDKQKCIIAAFKAR